MLAPGVHVRFDYRVLSNGLESEGVLVPLRGDDWLIDSSKYTEAEGQNNPDAYPPTVDQLDYALVHLDRLTGDWSGGPRRHRWSGPRLDRGARGPAADHPQDAADDPPSPAEEATPQAVPRHRGGLSVNANGTRVRYANNTDPGSSGSPVFDIQWNLVALHHFGDPAFHQAPTYNQGIPHRQDPRPAACVGREAALSGPPPT